MPKLTDLQAILLTHAARHDSGSMLPLPHDLADKPARTSPAIKALLKRGLAREKEVTASACVYRVDGDLSFGIFVTPAGLAALNIESDPGVVEAESAVPQSVTPMSKRDAVLILLRREDGATKAELIAATSWLPHTTRAAMTGLSKKGHDIERGRRENESFYRIVDAA